MSRIKLRVALSACVSVAAMLAYGAKAQSVVIPGGGASSPSQDYAGPQVAISANPTAPSEEFTFDSANSQYAFQYFSSSSGHGQTAFSTDNPSALGYTGSTPLPSSIKYAASDAFLAGTSGQTINGFTYTTVSGIPGITADYPLRSSQDGALIQIPMLGVAVAIPGLSGNAAVKTNGTLQLTDSDLCGIFSGLITNYGGISSPLAGVSGPIRVYYRGDSSGNSFQFTNHLKSVCNSGNSNFTAAGLAAAPSSTFTTLFTGSSVPTNFTPETGAPSLAAALAGTVTTSGGKTVLQAGDPTGIGYVGTDFTDISKNGAGNAIAAPSGGYINTRALFAAGLQGRTAGGAVAYLTPTVANLTLALAHAGAGSTNPKPPVGTKTTNPLNWIASVPLTTAGYPVVGYTTLELAQCYADPNVAAGLVAFLTAHFGGQAAYATTIKNNGFVLPATTFKTAIVKTFLTTGAPLAIAAAGTAGTCRSASGR